MPVGRLETGVGRDLYDERPMRRFAGFLAIACIGCAVDPGSPPVAQARRPGYVILAPRALAPSCKPLLQHRRGEFEAEVWVLEDVVARFEGADDAEKVKRFLYFKWRTGALKYALLVGDADVFPVRYMMLDRVARPAFDVAFYPSDLYYGDLATADGLFDDWNAAKNGVHAGYYGEVHGEHHKVPPVNFDGIDYRPEIGVGRWPLSTAEGVLLQSLKVVSYERGLDARSRRVGLVACGGWVDSRGSFEAVSRALSPGWEVEKLFYGDAEPDPGRVAELASGDALLVAHAGHGSEAGWAGCLAIDALRQWERLNATILVSAGCGTAVMSTQAPYEGYTDVLGAEHPGTNAGEVFSCEPPPPACYQPKHNPTSFGERSLQNAVGAVAYFGCDTGSQPCALTLVGAFVEGLSAQDEPRLGDLWRGAVSAYWDRERLAEIVPTESWYPASIFFQGMKFVLFGDPALRVVPRILKK
ncbi:MAG: Peptidase C25 [Planctomycetota bacterium]|nr:MAG: Peptidase C25 [Planctomycetota bacterium]